MARIHRKYGQEGLRVRSRAPRIYWKTPEETIRLILRLRRERNWESCKIEGYLENYYGKITPVAPTRFNTMISFLDYHSRFVLGSEIHHNPTGEHAIHLSEGCIHQYGKPNRILTDQGTQFHPARGDPSTIRVLKWKRYRAYRSECTVPINHRKDRILPQGIRP